MFIHNFYHLNKKKAGSLTYVHAFWKLWLNFSRWQSWSTQTSNVQAAKKYWNLRRLCLC